MKKLHALSLVIAMSVCSAAHAANLNDVIQKCQAVSQSLVDDGQSVDPSDLDRLDAILSQALQLAGPRFSLTFTMKSAMSAVTNQESKSRIASAGMKNSFFPDLQSLEQRCMAFLSWSEAAQCFNNGLAHVQDSRYAMDPAAGKQIAVTMCLGPLNWEDARSCFIGAVNVMGRKVRNQAQSCQSIANAQAASQCYKNAIQNSFN